MQLFSPWAALHCPSNCFGMAAVIRGGTPHACPAIFMAMRAHYVGEMPRRVLECEPPCLACDLKCLLDFSRGVPRNLYLVDHLERLVSPSGRHRDCRDGRTRDEDLNEVCAI